MSGEALRLELCRCVRDRLTGVVEWSDEKKRRLYFFEAGELVLAQSNLKSESLERVAEKNPGLSGADLKQRVLETRVAEALGAAGGVVRFHAGGTPPQRDPADVVTLLWAGAKHFPAPPRDAWPRAVAGAAPLLMRIPSLPWVLEYLLELDGTREVSDVVDIGPAEPEAIERALAVAWALGAVDFSGGEAASATVVAQGRSAPREEPPPVQPASPARGVAADDIAGLISDTIGTHEVELPSKRVDAAEARFGPVLARVRAAQNHFAVLGVSPEDPSDVVRKAYFALARELHPDRFASESADIQRVATEVFDRIRAAWEVLGDEKKREDYVAKEIRGEKTEDEKAMDKVRAILDAENDFRRGMAEFNAGRLPSAHDLFTRAANAVPEELEFGAYAGYTTFKLQNGRDEALAEGGVSRIRAALEANDRLDGVWVLLGLVHRAKGQEEAARRAFVSALKVKPANPDAARELKRLDREKEAAAAAAPPPDPKAGFFSKLFGKK
ncbi:MAG: DnaJ domain-containing protein [Myxococcota bacterium]